VYYLLCPHWGVEGRDYILSHRIPRIRICHIIDTKEIFIGGRKKGKERRKGGREGGHGGSC
jgi:hypothetical protein